MKAEQQLSNIKISAESKSESWDPVRKTWDLIRSTSVDAAYTGAPGSLAILRFRKDQILCHVGPKDMLAESSYVLAYDGRVGQKLVTSIWTLDGKPLNRLDGSIDKSRLQEIAADAACTGWRYSIYGYFDDSARRMSDVLATRLKTATISYEEFEGQHVIRVAISENGGLTSNMYFDPLRAYSLVGYETVNGNALLQRTTVLRTIKVNNIYYPEEVLAVGFKRLIVLGRPTDSTVYQEPQLRTAFHVLAATANDPQLPPATFDIQWPPHTMIDDHVTGLRYEVSGDK